MQAGSDQEDFLRQAIAGRVDGHTRHAAVLTEADGYLAYVFEPGQACFRASTHQLPQERDSLFSRRRGDWRVNLGEKRNYDRPDQWVDDMAHNLDEWRRIQNGSPT